MAPKADQILGFDFDNGDEWLNWALSRYLQVRAHPISAGFSVPRRGMLGQWARQAPSFKAPECTSGKVLFLCQIGRAHV